MEHMRIPFPSTLVRVREWRKNEGGRERWKKVRGRGREDRREREGRERGKKEERWGKGKRG